MQNEWQAGRQGQERRARVQPARVRDGGAGALHVRIGTLEYDQRDAEQRDDGQLCGSPKQLHRRYNPDCKHLPRGRRGSVDGLNSAQEQGGGLEGGRIECYV